MLSCGRRGDHALGFSLFSGSLKVRDFESLRKVCHLLFRTLITMMALERDVYIPGRNFDEMLQRLGSSESMINVILNSMSRRCLLLNQADRIVLMNPSAERFWKCLKKTA